MRRRHIKGELGGPRASKIMSSVMLTAYWLGYVAIVSWRALRYGTASNTEEMAVTGSIILGEAAITIVPHYILRKEAAPLQPPISTGRRPNNLE
mmetsp:Transcript_100458/g.322307  ORF Transcript_100458/g.322307 Transcript_100458/m.322307 type:complete len:94 (+) Transcript_100458:692-973(+)